MMNWLSQYNFWETSYNKLLDQYNNCKLINSVNGSLHHKSYIKKENKHIFDDLTHESQTFWWQIL